MTVTYGSTGVVQHFTAATSGYYLIQVDGAQGGASYLGGALDHTGGLGAAVGGDVYLAAGTKLDIVVGGMGAHGTGFSSTSGGIPTGPGGGGGGGGGGGSYVFEGSLITADLIAVAGGGGGGGTRGDGGAGQSGTHGANGGSGAAGGAGLQAGAGGAGSVPAPVGAGGGGFSGGNGAAGHSADGFAGSVSSTGFNFHFGVGAHATTAALSIHDTGGNGGFGGGGGGGIWGGGGGGGYGGGGGGGSGGAGGGGGSFFTSTSFDNGSSTANLTATSGAHSGNGEVQITFEGASLCYVVGSRIQTVRGEVAVEDLAIGDLAVTACGAPRPIMWLGHRKIDRPTPEQMPVRVVAGAFGEGLPARDLWLSPGHAVCVSVMEEMFVPVSELINGSTIARVEVPNVTYWHVELESHDVLLAEGLPCESYMDAGNRAFFGREYGRLGAIDHARVAESLTRYARPFVNEGPVVTAIRARLAARSERIAKVRSAA